MLSSAPWWGVLLGGGLLAGLAVRRRAATVPGATVGFLLLLAYSCCDSAAPLLCFVLFVVLGSMSSRWGREVKRARGVGQEKEGVRGVSNALANGGVGAAVLLGHQLVAVPADGRLAELAACAAVGACLADTLATEFGTWLGGTPRHVLTGRRMPPGTDGSVTGVGLGAAAGGAGLVGAVVAATGGVPMTGALLVVGAAYAGNLADSLLGATVERALGRAGNTVVNASASAVGAGGVLLLG